MANMKAYPIYPSTNSVPQLFRAKLLRYGHVTIAAAAGLCLPGCVTFGAVVLYGGDHAIFYSSWLTSLILLFLVGLMFHSMVTCSPFLLIGIVGVAFAALLPHGYGVALFYVGVTGFIGLAVAQRLYRALRSRHALPDACETHKALNPGCGTCRARSFCPYQPDGIADRYTR